ncbi:MAG: recombinase family protein [Rhodoplanes sp.]
MTRVALYARYSSDNQRDASIEDQLRLCRDYAARQSWTIVESYADRAVSGDSLLRAGIQAVIADAQQSRFDVVLTEALDRISRDQGRGGGIQASAVCRRDNHDPGRRRHLRTSHRS